METNIRCNGKESKKGQRAVQMTNLSENLTEKEKVMTKEELAYQAGAEGGHGSRCTSGMAGAVLTVGYLHCQ